MQFKNKSADIFVPDGATLPEALTRCRFLGVGAHQDDLEIMAYHGILRGRCSLNPAFVGVTCTDGSGSPRAGAYADFSDKQMAELRQNEQRMAAMVGSYAAMIQLNYGDGQFSKEDALSLKEDLKQIIRASLPEQIYTHNLADKHHGHITVAVALVMALRELGSEFQPDSFYGCEVWRGLDWLSDSKKVSLDVSEHDNLAGSLLGLYDSQVSGGKRYDLAALGRRRANATFLDTHDVDSVQAAIYAVDLMPLLWEPQLNPAQFVAGLIDDFRKEALDLLGEKLADHE